MTAEIANKLLDQKINGTDALGKDPDSGLPVYIMNGRYGFYVQLGDMESDKDKPKRVTVPTTMEAEKLSLSQALQLLRLPLDLGVRGEMTSTTRSGTPQ